LLQQRQPQQRALILRELIRQPPIGDHRRRGLAPFLLQFRQQQSQPERLRFHRRS